MDLLEWRLSPRSFSAAMPAVTPGSVCERDTKTNVRKKSDELHEKLL